METIECKHKEHVRDIGHGESIGTCGECGQQVKYVDGVAKAIVKLGRINGRLVLPNPKLAPHLGARDAAAIAEAQVAAPEEKAPEEMTTWERHRYLEKHREEIEADIAALGPEAARKKWKISPGGFQKIKKRWNIAEPPRAPKAPKVTKRRQRKSAKASQSHQDGKLPPLPAWSDNWPAETQVKWLEIWETLNKIKKGG